MRITPEEAKRLIQWGMERGLIKKPAIANYSDDYLKRKHREQIKAAIAATQ